MKINTKISNGFCQCGCGGKTPIAEWSNARRGWIKSEPKSFINYHHCKKERNPNWKGGSYKWIVEKIFGKPLPINSVIHHIDGNRHNNFPSNLVVCQDRAYHLLIHQRQRSFKACGHADWLKCSICKKYDDPVNLFLVPGRNQGFHRECQNEYKRNRYAEMLRLMASSPSHGSPQYGTAFP